MKDLILNNDRVFIGISDTEHTKDLLLIDKGEHKFYPLIGAGIWGYINNDESGDLLSKVRYELEKDGMIVEVLKIANGKMEIQGKYL